MNKTIENKLIKWLSIGLLCSCFAHSAVAVGLLTERTYKKLSRIHELIGDNKYRDALTRLDALSKRIRNNKYEIALVNQTYGYIHATRENYPKAIAYYKKSLDSGTLDKRLISDIRFALGQLYILSGEYRQGITILAPMLDSAERSTAQVQALAASAYVELKQYNKAAGLLESAIGKSARPRDSWLQLLLSVYYQLKQYTKAAQLLETLVARYPQKKLYWDQLTSVYYRAKKPLQSLATLELAYTRGLLKNAKDLNNLISLYLLNNIPLKAAQVLEQGMEQDVIKANEKNLLKLADIWLMAREVDKALRAYRKVSALRPNNDIDFKRAQLLMAEQRWGDVIQLTGQIIKRKPGTQQLARAYWLQGMAHFEDRDYQQALAAFRKIDSTSKYAVESRRWIEQINTVVSLLD